MCETQTVRPERSGWRDLALSQRHRQWGWDCPAVDVDFLLVEYDGGKASALVEYKHEQAPWLRVWHPTVRALIDLANRAELPAFVVRYASDFSWWLVRPINQLAQDWLPETRRLTERQWVALLFRIRGREMPAELNLAGGDDSV